MSKQGVLRIMFHGGDAGAARDALREAGLTAVAAGRDGTAAGPGDEALLADFCRRFPALGLRGSLRLPDERTDFFSLPGSGAYASFRRLSGELGRREAFSPLWNSDAAFLTAPLPDGAAMLTAWARWESRAGVPERVDGRRVTAIGPGVFLGRADLREVSLPDGVDACAEDAFAECPDLTVFTPNPELAARLAALGVAVRDPDARVILRKERVADGWAITGVTGEATALEIPAEIDGLPVTELGIGALRGQDALWSLRLSEGLRRIGRDACFGCARLRELVLPDSVTGLGASAFQGCAGLERLRLSRGLREIPARAFYNCASLTALEVPEGVVAIGESAFAGCAGLRLARLPEGLEVIGPGAFAGCAQLTDMPIPESVRRISADALPYGLTPGGILYLEPQGMLVRADVKRTFAVPEGARSIADHALEGCVDLLEILLPGSLERIGDYALAGCHGLKAARLPDGATELGRGAFSDCQRLQEVRLPGGLRAIPGEAFSRCWALEAIELPGSLEAVGERAFEDCRSLRRITLPEGIRAVGAHAFFRCEGLEAIGLPGSLETLGTGALTGCRSLREIALNGPYRPEFEPVFAEVRRAVLLAPRNPPEDFPGLWRKRVCLGYAAGKARGMAWNPEAEAACLAWMRAHGSAFVAEALRDAALMRLLAENDCLSLRDVETLLSRVEGPKQPEYAATLLAYRHRRFGGAVDAAESLW